MLSIEEMFVQKTSERTEKESKSLSERTIKSERENSVQEV